MRDHDHDHGHEHHTHGGMSELLEHRHAPLGRIYASIGITLGGMVLEIAGGLLSGSIALLSDAGHMFTHVFALGISALAVRQARVPPCHHRTFGLLRAEVLAAYTNALFLFGVTAYIVYESTVRLLNPVEILTREMLLVAAVGLVVNLASIVLLHGHGKNISIRSAVAHMMADAVSSIAIVLGALIMGATGWKWIDPVLSIGIAGVIFLWAWGLFRDTTRILMEVAPAHVNTDDVTRFILAEFDGVERLEQARIWSITEDVVVFSAHVILGRETGARTDLSRAIAESVRTRFSFAEITLQLIEEIPASAARSRDRGACPSSADLDGG